MRGFAVVILSALMMPGIAVAADADSINAAPAAVTPLGDATQHDRSHNGIPDSAAQDYSMPKQEIGYDAKVKRDPYGKIIAQDKDGQPVVNPPKQLRNDRAMRSDRERFGKPEPTPQPVNAQPPKAGASAPVPPQPPQPVAKPLYQ